MTKYRAISLDENAYNILVSIKEKLKGRGITASYSDAIRYLAGVLNLEEKEVNYGRGV